MLVTDCSTVPPCDIGPGFHGRYLHSHHVTPGRVDLDSGALFPEHSHRHGQWTTILTGALQRTVAGVTRGLRPRYVDTGLQPYSIW